MTDRRHFIKQSFSLGVLSAMPDMLKARHNGGDTGLDWHASGRGGIVAAGPRPSAQAGVDILEKGGNAIDAAVAVVFNLAVSDYGMFSIGGEVPFMFYDAKSGKVNVYNGMGGAPKDQGAIDWYYENGIPEGGIRAATTPSAVSTCLTALEKNGTLSFGEIIAPTLALLDTGKESWYKNLAITLRKLTDTEKNTIGSRETKIKAARDRFYKGDIADELNNYYINAGGFLRKADLESHVTHLEESVSVKYREYTVHKCNTWTQGPVFLQSLKLLEKFDLRSMGSLSPDYIHVTTEAMKLAFADRDKYYGDPEFVDVPLQKLLSDQYTAIRYPLINMKEASSIIRPGNPYSMEALAGAGQFWPGEHGTTTCVIADRWGNVVAATPSSNPDYGLCESLGIAHNTRLSSLNIQRDHPNSLQPGKRPRITLTPTIILENGKPIVAMSVAGQDVQDQVSLQLFLDFAEFGMQPKKAITVPRFRTYHHEHSFIPSADPQSRIVSIGAMDVNMMLPETISNLSARGHKIKTVEKVIGFAAMVVLDNESGMRYAAAEPGRKFCGAEKQ
jgi:gamma-glutamyltranspeptidase/glutathione hydrolase